MKSSSELLEEVNAADWNLEKNGFNAANIQRFTAAFAAYWNNAIKPKHCEPLELPYIYFERNAPKDDHKG